MLLKAVTLLMCPGILLINFTAANNKIKKNNTLLDKSDFELVFERVELVRYSKLYYKKYDVVTFKYNRTTAAINLTWIHNIAIDEFDVVIQAYKFASNEYRTFPLRFQFSFCDGMKNNIVGLRQFIQCGNFTGCPFERNILIRVCNWFPDQSHFPPLIPAGKYMAEIQAVFRTTELYLLRGYGSIVYRIV